LEAKNWRLGESDEFVFSTARQALDRILKATHLAHAVERVLTSAGRVVDPPASLFGCDASH
jgi:hypothetical protein